MKMDPNRITMTMHKVRKTNRKKKMEDDRRDENNGQKQEMMERVGGRRSRNII